MDLRSHRFFNHFPAEQADKLARTAKVKKFPEKSVIFLEGSVSDSIYLVLEGRVVLTKEAPGGYTQLIAHKAADDYFGELGVLDSSGRSTAAVAETAVKLARLDKAPFLKVLSQSPWHTIVRLFNHVSENLRATNDRFVSEVVRKEKITLIGEMANGMIHDFKSPFTTIRLAVDMISMTHQDESTQKMCQVVMRQIRRLGGMVEEVLEFAKGNTQLKREPVRIEALFESLAESNAEAIQHTATKFVVRPTPLLAAIDFDRFIRVLQNLVTNALEAIGPEKSGLITLAAERKGRMCELTVSDNGPGIPRAIRSTLFEPFVSHGKRGGTGLGLAIAKSVVEAHGGSIAYRSSSRTGTKFVIRLPLVV